MAAMILEELQRFIQNILRNWKTSLMGVIILVLVSLLGFRIITAQEFATSLGAIAGLGFFLSKDGNKTGVK